MRWFLRSMPTLAGVVKNYLILIPYLAGNVAEMNGLGRDRKK